MPTPERSRSPGARTYMRARGSAVACSIRTGTGPNTIAAPEGEGVGIGQHAFGLTFRNRGGAGAAMGKTPQRAAVSSDGVLNLLAVRR